MFGKNRSNFNNLCQRLWIFPFSDIYYALGYLVAEHSLGLYLDWPFIIIMFYHEKVIELSTAISCHKNGNGILEKFGSIVTTKLLYFLVKPLFWTKRKPRNFVSIMWPEVCWELQILLRCFACLLQTKVGNYFIIQGIYYTNQPVSFKN